MTSKTSWTRRAMQLTLCLVAISHAGCGGGAMSQAESDARAALQEMGAIIVNDANGVHPATIMLMSDSVKQNLDQAISHVGDLPYLTHIEATDLGLTDEHMTTIGKLKRLNSLVLSGTNISDVGLAEAGKLKKLDTLFVSNTSITPAAMDVIGRMSKLKILDVSSCDVVSNLSPLKQLQDLEWLVMDDMEIGGDAMDIIATLPKLGRLSLKGSTVQESDLAKLKAAKPRLAIDLTSANPESTPETEAAQPAQVTE